MLQRALPESASKAISVGTTKALDAALTVALRTIEHGPQAGSPVFHRALAATSGAMGGGFGFAALPIELPISTIIMLRSIADIARSEGEVDASESSYFAVRAMLAKSISEAARYIAERGAAAEGAPLLLRLLQLIAARFGLVVSQKFAAQAVPIIGAVGGAAVNYAFIDHFQEIARAHFTVRRLERSYGRNVVRGEYEKLREGRMG